jgi:hypothetical protein
MGGGEAAGVGGIGESPATMGQFHGIPPGGLTLKRKLAPKKSPKKLSVNKNWKKSFAKFGSKIAGGRGA